MKLSHLRIGTRLWLAVALFVGALLLLITFAAVRSVQSQAAAEVLLSQAETKVKLATRWAGLTEVAVGRVQILALSNEPALAQTLKPLND